MWAFLLNWRVSLLALGAIALFAMGIALKVATAERDAAKAQLQALSLELNDQNAAISEWQRMAEAQSEALQQAESAVLEQKKHYDFISQEIMGAGVSADCQKAIQWGIMEGLKLAKDW